MKNLDTEMLEDDAVFLSANKGGSAEFWKDVYGVFGCLGVGTKKFLMVIDEASLMGQILKCNTYRVDSILFVPLQKGEM